MTFKNRERQIKMVYNKTWREKNREKKKTCDNLWYQKNREKHIAHSKTWNQNNREKCLAYGKTWREKNREKNLSRMKAWVKANPGKVCVNNRIYREKIKGISPIGITLNERFEGSELHHTGVLELETETFYGVYIPKSMNRDHCAQFGKEHNLERVNFDAIEFLVRELDK